MRRTDYQIHDPGEIEAILRRATCVRLGFADHGLGYIVPMSFGLANENGKLCLYFHSAPKGKKIDLIKAAGIASFEADIDYELKEGAQACEFSCFYQSVMGHGRISILDTKEDTLHALRCVMEHYTGNADWDIPEKMLSVTVGIRLEIDEITGKAHRLPQGE